MGSKRLNFNDSVRRIPQKSLTSSVLLHSLTMIKIIMERPEWSGVTAYPYKYLPVMSIPSERVHGGLEGIVMPKGTIVSLVTANTTITDGIPVPTASGEIPVFLDQLDAGTIISKPIDDSFFGYDESVTALLVPANGGSASTIPYSALDTTIGLWNDANDASLVLGANIPYGIMAQDVYQDIRGANLNYQTHDSYSTIISGRMSIPFVDTGKLATFGSDASVAAGLTDGYTSVWRNWAFCQFDSTATPVEGLAGQTLKSDLYGKFVIESAATSANITVQTVGRLQALDCRFPKDLSGLVQNYYGTELLGTNTAGIPTDLYKFAQTILAALGQASTRLDILEAVQDGMFGYARIQVGNYL